LLNYQETPVQEVRNPAIESAGVRLFVKREDLNHPTVSGNKWWKLKYNLDEALKGGHTTLLTFGGAYSNHIYATAAAAQVLGLHSIGVIRGEEMFPLNPTLSFAKACGMQLKFISRDAYRRKTENEFIGHLHHQYGDFFLIPEGGTNELALKGCEEFAKDILSGIHFDYLCLAAGTGGTLAGIVRGLDAKREVIGFSALKGGSFLNEEISTLLTGNSKPLSKWRIETDYHFGGYGKRTRELEDFMIDQWRVHHIPLDRVYTSKMLYGVYDLIRRAEFPRGSTLLALHTGGLQGDLLPLP
jgi:1-aminocyclopropane-1-carboxylate deaminase